MSAPGERVFVADGWGQRDWKNSDLDATLPYVVRRTEGDGLKLFVSVFEGVAGGKPFVRSVVSRAPGVLAIETALGTDYVMSEPAGGVKMLPTLAGERAVRGPFAVIAVQAGRVAWTYENSPQP